MPYVLDIHISIPYCVAVLGTRPLHPPTSASDGVKSLPSASDAVKSLTSASDAVKSLMSAMEMSEFLAALPEEKLCELQESLVRSNANGVNADSAEDTSDDTANANGGSSKLGADKGSVCDKKGVSDVGTDMSSSSVNGGNISRGSCDKMCVDLVDPEKQSVDLVPSVEVVTESVAHKRESRGPDAGTEA